MTNLGEVEGVRAPNEPWYKLLPVWFKVAAPAVAALVAVSGFFLGQGEGKGRIEETVAHHERRISNLEAYREIDRADINKLTEKLVGQISEIRGELTAIRAYFKIPAPGVVPEVIP